MRGENKDHNASFFLHFIGIMYNERKQLFKNKRGKKVATKISYVIFYVKKLRYYPFAMFNKWSNEQLWRNIEVIIKITPLLIHTTNFVFVL